METTLAVDEVEGVVTALRERFPQLTGPKSDDICYATTNRQDALRAVAADADVVVGSSNSSNSVRLVETAERNGTEAHLIDDVRDMDLVWLVGGESVGLTAGASTPARLVTETIDALRGFGAVAVLERVVAGETIQFVVPREISRCA